MAGHEAQLFIEAMGVRTTLVRGQLYKVAAACTALLDRPFEHLLTQARVAAMSGNAYRFDLSAPRAHARDAWNEGKL